MTREFVELAGVHKELGCRRNVVLADLVAATTVNLEASQWWIRAKGFRVRVQISGIEAPRESSTHSISQRSDVCRLRHDLAEMWK